MQPSTIFDRAFESQIFTEYKSLLSYAENNIQLACGIVEQIQELLLVKSRFELRRVNAIPLEHSLDSNLKVAKTFFTRKKEWRGAEELSIVANSQYLVPDPRIASIYKMATLNAHSFALGVAPLLNRLTRPLQDFIKSHPLNCPRYLYPDNPPTIELNGQPYAVYAVGNFDVLMKRNNSEQSLDAPPWLDEVAYYEWRKLLRVTHGRLVKQFGEHLVPKLVELSGKLQVESYRVLAFLSQNTWLLKHDIEQTEADDDLVSRKEIGALAFLEKSSIHEASQAWGPAFTKIGNRHYWTYQTIRPKLVESWPQTDWPATANEVKRKAKAMLNSKTAADSADA